MSKTYSKYINNEEHNWYDSSNIIYSVYFDNQKDGNKSMKIVFKGGRTYLYKDVTPIEYSLFANAPSQGKIFNETIKNYECVKQDDTDVNELESMRLRFIESDNSQDFDLHLKLNEKTGEFQLYLNGLKVFESVENQVSIINLFRAIGMKYSYEITEETNQTTEEFEQKKIIY